MTALRALLAGIVDYAGLFPPAGLGLPEAMRNYADYRSSDDAWLLGRFVVPVARLPELVALLESRSDGWSGPWRLAVLAGEDAPADLKRAREFNHTHRELATIDFVEAKLADGASIDRAADAAEGLELFAELPSAADPAPLVDTLARRGVRAKLRTGGVVPSAFPTAAAAVRFVRACIGAGVPFKATAGLHHPVTGTYPLTYAPGSAVQAMFGFVNLFVAAAAMATGLPNEAAADILAEPEATAFQIDAGAIRWRDREVTTGAIARARANVVRSFGSCSFREPVEGVARAWRGA